MAEKIKKGPDTGGESLESKTGIEKLSTKWQIKVRDSLAVERTLFKQRDGKLPDSYYELEKKLVDEAKLQSDKEDVLFKKIKAKLGSFGSTISSVGSVVGGAGRSTLGVVGSIGSATLGALSVPAGFVAEKAKDAGLSMVSGLVEIARRNKLRSSILLALTLSTGAYTGYEQMMHKEPAPLSAWSQQDGAAFDGLAYRAEYKRIKEADLKIKSKNGEVLTTEPVIQNLDNFDIPTQTMRQIVKDTLPVNSFSSVKVIEFNEKLENMPQRHSSGIDVARFFRESGRLVFTEGSRDFFNSAIVNKVLLREVARSNDWISNRHLSAGDRVVLMEMVASRLTSFDRYEGGKAELVKTGKINEETPVKTEEYFADIFSAYLSDDYVKLPDSDKKVVKWLIDKMDPSFDREAALAKRNQLVGQCEEDTMKKIASSLFHKVF